MNEKYERRFIIWFLTKAGRNNEEIREQLQAVYGERPLRNTAVKKWAGRFQVGWNLIKDEECEGQPCSTYSADNAQKVKLIVEMNCKVTIRETAEHISINRETVRLILYKELGMRKICAVPKVLSPDQKQMQVE